MKFNKKNARGYGFSGKNLQKSDPATPVGKQTTLRQSLGFRAKRVAL